MTPNLKGVTDREPAVFLAEPKLKRQENFNLKDSLDPIDLLPVSLGFEPYRFRRAA